MSTELIINASLPETRIALMESGEIQDLIIERASGKGIVGNIYKGRVTRVLPGMQAAFVDIGLEKAAFLYVDDVFVHSEMWEEDEGAPEAVEAGEGGPTRNPNKVTVIPVNRGEGDVAPAIIGAVAAGTESAAVDSGAESAAAAPSAPAPIDDAEVAQWEGEARGGSLADDEEEDEAGDDSDLDDDEGEDDEDDSDDKGPVGMCPPPGEGDEGGSGEDPKGTVRPPVETAGSSGDTTESGEASSGQAGQTDEAGGRRRHRRGRRGGRFRKRTGREEVSAQADGTPGAAITEGAGGAESERPQIKVGSAGEDFSDNYRESAGDEGQSDRSSMTDRSDAAATPAEGPQAGRPQIQVSVGGPSERQQNAGGKRPEFKEPRSRDRRIKTKQAARPIRGQAKIEDLLKEGQEVLVQVAKDPISTKGARLTCHISLPGRHLVCMPTIDHVGVSRRIERDDERRKLREYVERYRPKNLGFIVRTASGRQQSEKRIKQDIEYLTRLWSEIREKAANVTAPALVYEDLNSVLRAIRDWVTEDIDKIIVDSRYHFNDIQRFVSHFMPSLKQKVELYHGDVPIFDAYNISTELARGLERKVWLKSGGYLVVDQAEALVAIDVNTGRFVGKKNLEDTILKTNLEAVVEIAYQLRLRNCGGIIILDLIDMEREENKQRVYRALEEALKKDRARPSILKISELGLVEMTRKRTRDTMVRALCESCSHCEGKGFVKSKQTMAYEVLRELEREGIERDIGKVLVQANPDVIDILAIDERDTLDQLERRYRKQIYLQAVTDFHVERFEVTGDKREKGERGQELSSDDDRGPRQERGRNGREPSGGGDRDRGGRGGRNRGGRDRGDSGRDSGRDNNRDRGDQSRPSGVLIKPLDTPIPISVDPVAFVADPNGMPLAQGAGEGRVPGKDDFYDEEDRLAFLRAQATQDAALARLAGAAAGGPGAEAPRRGSNQGGGRGTPSGAGLGRAPQDGGSDEGARRGRRGRRGGKHSGKSDRGPRSAGPRGPVAPAGGTGITPVIRPVTIRPLEAGSDSGSAGGASGGSGSDAGGGSSGGSNDTPTT